MSRGTVLVVEDDPDVRELLRDVLVPLGYDLTAMSAPPGDVREVAARDPDVILLDLNFGGGEVAGVPFLEQLRRDRETHRLPVVICTASVGDVQAQEARLAQYGARVVLKPFDLDRLDSELQAAIGSRPASVH